jgi:hydrogenase maturation protease
MAVRAEPTRVLVAGVGNIFLGDDGFGVEVACRMAARALPAGVRAVDFGIRSLHLAYELLDHPGVTTILVDAMPRGGVPGSVYVVEPDPAADAPVPAADAHGVTPDGVLALVRALGGMPGRVVVVGCEPADCDERIGLSEPVAAAVDAAVDRVLSVVADELNHVPCHTGPNRRDR